MDPSLPAAIVAHLTALGAALVASARAHRDACLATHEAAVQRAIRAALPGLLRAVTLLATPDLDPGIATVARRCPRCGQRVRMQELRRRTVHTTCGRVRLRRPWYQCARCHRGFSPADATLGLPPRAGISPALHAWLVRLNVTTTEREAATLLADLTGVVVAADTIRAHTTHAGMAVVAEDAVALAQVAATGEAAALVDPAPGTLVVEADGAMVRYTDGWHEVKVGVVGGVADGEVTAASYVAAREEATAFG